MAQDPDEVALRDRADAGSTASPSLSAATERIRVDIEETRAELSETIEAIQARLSPSNLLNQAARSAKEATVGTATRLGRTLGERAEGLGSRSSRTAADVVRHMRSNPVPTALVGGAVVGLLVRGMSRRRKRDGRAPSHFARRYASRRDDVQPDGRWNAGFWVATGASAACWILWKSRGRFPAGRVSSDWTTVDQSWE